MASTDELTIDDLILIKQCLRQIMAGSVRMDRMIGTTARDRFNAEQLTALENKILALIEQKKTDENR